jgi:hypothetical protein
LGLSFEAEEGTEVPDLNNGATKKTEESEKKTTIFFSVLFVGSVAPFLRSGTSKSLRRSAPDEPDAGGAP